MSHASIGVVETEEGLFSRYSELQKVPLIGIKHSELLIGCLRNRLVMILGYIDDKEVGMGIVERKGNTMHILAVSAKNNARKLMAAFYQWSKGLGCEKVTMMSAFDRKAYEKLFGVSHLTSIYTKEL